jgi:hypothetical protein
MADVFLSYSREDAARARQVASAMEQAGYSVFWDNEIPPGSTWADYLEEKLTSAKVLVVLWSKASTQSQWVREEARLGRESGKLVPVLLDGAAPPFGFGEVQAASLADWTGAADHPDWKRFLAGVEAMVRKGGGAPKPKPAQPTARPAATPVGGGWNAGGAAAQPVAAAAAAAPAKGMPAWQKWAVGGLAGLGALALIGLFVDDGQSPGAALDTPPTASAPNFGAASGAGDALLPPEVLEVVAQARQFEAQGRAAMTQAQTFSQAGQMAEQAAMANQFGFGTINDLGGTLSGQLSLIQAGQPAPVAFRMQLGQFHGQLHVTGQDSYSLNGVIRVPSGSSGAGVWNYRGQSADFVGAVDVLGKVSWVGKETGDTVTQEARGVGVVRYTDGRQYLGEYRTVGQGDQVQIFRHGRGVAYSAKGDVEAAGQFANDDFQS